MYVRAVCGAGEPCSIFKFTSNVPRLTPLPAARRRGAAQHMAPAAAHQRAASAAAAEATCLLLDLSHDEVSIVTHELCDPLQPLLAVHLSSKAKGLREAMEEQLAQLKGQRQGAAALAALRGWSCALRGWSCAQLLAARFFFLFWSGEAQSPPDNPTRRRHRSARRNAGRWPGPFRTHLLAPQPRLALRHILDVTLPDRLHGSRVATPAVAPEQCRPHSHAQNTCTLADAPALSVIPHRVGDGVRRRLLLHAPGRP